MRWLKVGSFHLLNLANQKDFKLTLIKKSCRGAAEAFTRNSFSAVKLVIRMKNCHLPLSQGCWSTPGSLKTGTVYVTHNLSPISASVRQVGQNFILILTLLAVEVSCTCPSNLRRLTLHLNQVNCQQTQVKLIFTWFNLSKASLPPSIRHFSVSNCSFLELGPIFLLSSSSEEMNQLETVIIQNIGELKIQTRALHFVSQTTVVLRNIAGKDLLSKTF